MSTMLYSVLILNYNTAAFARRAIQSLLETAQTDGFTIQLVDNASSLHDQQLLLEIQHPKLFTILSPQNKGFATGYNMAARAALLRDDPAYLVIMNPDIELTQPGTIEHLVDHLQTLGHPIVGAQPLVWDYRFAKSAESNLAIRRVPSYWDLVITESVLLRYVFARRFRRFTMKDAHLDHSPTIFEVPSGAFFVIDARVFAELNGFDEATFLYGEEFILGKRLKDRGLQFVLVPTVSVKHYQGASTRFEYQTPSRSMYKHRMESDLYYAREYLGAGPILLIGLRLAAEIGFWIRRIAWAPRQLKMTLLGHFKKDSVSFSGF